MPSPKPAEMFLARLRSVAELPDHAESGVTLIAAADAALYQAKNAGCDRVVAYRKPAA